MRIAFFTNEYPPNVYGGAGVHVEYLARELARAQGGRHTVDVFCFGDQREDYGNLKVHGVSPRVNFAARDPRHERLLEALVRDLAMVAGVSSFALREQVRVFLASQPDTPASRSRVRLMVIDLWTRCVAIGMLGSILAWGAASPVAAWPFVAGGAALLLFHAPRPPLVG